jgi:hemerythrin-like domain-containing protein
MKDTQQDTKRNAPRDPIELLRKEHGEGLKHLERLGNAADSIKANGFSVEAFEEIVNAVRWMNTDVRRHTDREEKYLFPLIERHSSNLPELMRGEHRELGTAFTQLLDIVREIEEGRVRGSSIYEVVQLSYLIVDLMRIHINRENQFLFPLAKKLLSSSEYEALTENMFTAKSAEA